MLALGPVSANRFTQAVLASCLLTCHETALPVANKAGLLEPATLRGWKKEPLLQAQAVGMWLQKSPPVAGANPKTGAQLIHPLDSPIGTDASKPRLIWFGDDVTLLGGPSRDGRYFSFVDPASGELAVRELASTQRRLVTRKPAGSREFAYFSSISPDSTQVAYAWFNEAGFYDLRLVGLDGSAPRVLYRNEEAGFVQPCAWSPDGKHILTLFFRKDNISQIALVPVDRRPIKVLRSLNWVYPKKMDFSPDGRFIVYDSFSGSASGERTIFLLAVDAARETRLVELPGNHLFPLWTPDGRRVIFASDRQGTMDAWMIDVVDGKPQGEPRILRRDLGRFLPMGITLAGEYYFGLRSGETDVIVAGIGNPTEKPQRATLQFPGRNTAPAWSTDGQWLAYLSRRGPENFGQESRVIVVRSIKSDQERELAPKLAHLERLRWSPDGQTLLVSGSDNKGRGGLFVVDAKNGTTTPLVLEAGASFRGFEGVWSKDGNSVFYLYADSELRARVLPNGGETTLYRGTRLRHLTVAMDGSKLALAEGEDSIVILPAAGGEKQRIRFEGLSELEWGQDLYAGRGAELWRILLSTGAPQKLEMPGNRAAGFSLHPDGKRLALTVGKARSEVWVLRLPMN
jgi:Tol biopolymer transport system component